MHFPPARRRAWQQARRPHHSELSAALDASDGASFLTKAASMALPPAGLDLDLGLASGSDSGLGSGSGSGASFHGRGSYLPGQPATWGWVGASCEVR